MATQATPKQPQQGGSTTPSQMGGSDTSGTQPGQTQPVFRDWAAI